MPPDRESQQTQIARFEQQLEQLQQRYNRLDVRRIKLQQQLERLAGQFNNLEMRIDKYQQQLEHVIRQQTPLLWEQQQLEHLITLLKQQSENEN
jgi:predicted nuclease with TOPRIM domain